MVKRSLSQPKEHLKKLVMQEFKEPYIFEVALGEGDNMIHRIRVELSRLRKKLIDMGKVPKPFKILKRSIQQVPERNVDIVILIKAIENDSITEEVSAMIDEMTLGEMISE